MPQQTQSRQLAKTNPATGKIIREYPVTDGLEVVYAAHQAKKAQLAWGATDPGTRARVLLSAAEKLYGQAEHLAGVISEEVGKSVPDAMEADIAAALNIIRYTARSGRNLLQGRRISPDTLSRLVLRSHWEIWHPRGLIGIISPWNYPVAIPAGGIAAALMAGNAVLFKPSEHAPECGLRLGAIFRQALMDHGHSPDLLQIVVGDGETGQAVMDAPIDGIIFTGSAKTGRQIHQQAAERGIWSSLELGGSDAMLVLEGTDPDWASSQAVWGRFFNAGQACAAVKRLFLPQSLAPQMLAMLREKISHLKVGSPTEAENHYGPLISETQRELIDAQVQDALARGATLLAGGEKAPGPGWGYLPTLLCNVPPEARVLREETFGPVLCVIAYDDLNQAIKQINDTPYGLTTSIFGPPELARPLSYRIESGTVVINELGMTNFAMACAPWGGWKDSGHGRSHGSQTLTDLCQLRIVSESGLWQIPFLKKPVWLFPSQAGFGAMDKARALLEISRGGVWQRPGQLLKVLSVFWQHRSSRKL